MPLAEKVPKAASQDEKVEGVKKKTKKHSQTYQTSIYKVLKQVHPKMRISKQAMSIMESCVLDTFERLAKEANSLCRMSKKGAIWGCESLGGPRTPKGFRPTFGRHRCHRHHLMR